MKIPAINLNTAKELKILLALLSCGIITCPLLIHLWAKTLGSTDSLLTITKNILQIIQNIFVKDGIRDIRETGILLIAIFLPYGIYLAIRAIRQGTLKRIQRYICDRPRLLVSLLFLLPAIIPLSLLLLVYQMAYWGWLDVSYQILHHIRRINDYYPIMIYSAGVFISAYTISNTLIKSRSYLKSALLGVTVYVLAVAIMVLLVYLYQIVIGKSDINKLLLLPFTTLIAFTGFCFQDRIYGYAWPSIPFGAIWAVLLMRHMTSPNKKFNMNLNLPR